MKKTALILITLFCFSKLYSQKQMEIGVIGGPYFKIDNYSKSSSYNLGFVFNYRTDSNFSFSTGFNYTNHNLKFNGNLFEEDCLNIPLLVNYELLSISKYTLRMQAGVNFSYNLNVKLTQIDSVIVDARINTSSLRRYFLPCVGIDNQFQITDKLYGNFNISAFRNNMHDYRLVLRLGIIYRLSKK